MVGGCDLVVVSDEGEKVTREGEGRDRREDRKLLSMLDKIAPLYLIKICMRCIMGVRHMVGVCHMGLSIYH